MYDQILLTPSLARQLKLSKALADKLRIYNISLKDPYFLAKKNLRDSIIDKAKWSLSLTSATLYVKLRLYTILNNNKLKNIHLALYKGISVQLIIYDLNGKVIDLIDIPINYLKYKKDLSNNYDIVYKILNKKAIELDNTKLIVSLSNNFINNIPIGISLILIDMLTLKYITLYKQLAKYNEGISMPSIWGTYKSDNQKLDLAKAVKSIGTNIRGIIPSLCTIDYLLSKANGTDTFFTTIDMINSLISRLLIGVVNSGLNGVGSYSALLSQISIKLDLTSNSLDIVTDSINKYLIPRICELIGSTDYPEFLLKINRSKDINIDKELYSMGVRFSKKYLALSYGINLNLFLVIIANKDGN